MELLATLTNALNARDTRMNARFEAIENAMAEQNNNMRAIRDCNGRYHAPCNGYMVDEHSYRKGEYIRDSLETIEAKEEAGLTPSSSRTMKARHLIAVSDKPAITTLCNHDAIVSLSFGKAFDDTCYAYVETNVKAVITAINASEEQRKTEAYNAIEKSGEAPVGRVAVSATVLSIKIIEGAFGYQQKMLVKLSDGATAYGSVPAAISEVQVGDTVTFTGTFKTADNGVSHAFFSRPSKASIDTVEGVDSDDVIAESMLDDVNNDTRLIDPGVVTINDQDTVKAVLKTGLGEHKISIHTISQRSEVVVYSEHGEADATTLNGAIGNYLKLFEKPKGDIMKKRLHNLYCIKGFYIDQWYGENSQDAVVRARLSGLPQFRKAHIAKEVVS